MNKIAVLCCSTNSIYKEIEGLDCYDKRRDARTYSGPSPVITHAPCRGWSAFTRSLAKPEAGERMLAPFCINMVLRYGGVFEHPAFSTIYTKYLGIRPGETKGPFRCLEIDQYWFGFQTSKRTWLLMPKHWNQIPVIPYKLLPSGKKDEFMKLSTKARSETSKSFALWLIELVTLNN